MLVVLGASPLAGYGLDTVEAKVQRDGQLFDIDFSVRVNAPAHSVYALLTNYERLAEISPSTRESGWIDVDGEPALRVMIYSCVLIFCKRMVKLSRVTPLGNRSSRYQGIAEGSSFLVADELISVSVVDSKEAGKVDDGGDVSVVRYTARLNPRFRVPAIIRPWMIRLVLERDLRQTLANVESELSPEGLGSPANGYQR